MGNGYDRSHAILARRNADYSKGYEDATNAMKRLESGPQVESLLSSLLATANTNVGQQVEAGLELTGELLEILTRSYEENDPEKADSEVNQAVLKYFKAIKARTVVMLLGHIKRR